MVPQLSFQRTPVTLLLMAILTALELFTLIQREPNEARIQIYNQWLGILPWGELVGQDALRWQIWRPFTTTLIHGGILHAFFNIYIFAIFGSVVEGWLRWHRMLLLVLFLAFASMVPQFLWTNYLFREGRGLTAIVGFSGVNYGLFGLVWFGRRYRGDFAMVCDPATVQQMIAWLLLCFVLTWAGILPVANVAHTAGLVFGVLIALTVFRPRERWKWAPLLAGGTVGVLMMVAFPELVLRGAFALSLLFT
jgi:membrane associated rhomboid family serine protease